MELIDTHAHLTAPEFAQDLPSVLQQAWESGVVAIICVGYDVPSSKAAVTLAEQEPRVFATVGVHPNAVAQAPNGWEREVEALARHERVVAIGETGLDFYRTHTPPDQQKRALAWHLELAARLRRPVIIHNREADEALEATLVPWAQSRGGAWGQGVLHAFSGRPSLMERCTRVGFLVSFAGMLTYPRAEHVVQAARAAPSDHLLVETDSPYLAPQPHRGRRNQPAWVRHVLDRLAAVRDEPAERTAEQTTRNARAIFGLGAVRT
jgi:TatD DNase family protein